ncbi:hypothetical protein CDIK_2385 [Cucumispora dikerogammari]|nr:hypothetical protein CDIK_2385 [Cucumispora dikerogammari]
MIRFVILVINNQMKRFNSRYTFNYIECSNSIQRKIIFNPELNMRKINIMLEGCIPFTERRLWDEEFCHKIIQQCHEADKTQFIFLISQFTNYIDRKNFDICGELEYISLSYRGQSEWTKKYYNVKLGIFELSTRLYVGISVPYATTLTFDSIFTVNEDFYMEVKIKIPFINSDLSIMMIINDKSVVLISTHFLFKQMNLVQSFYDNKPTDFFGNELEIKSRLLNFLYILTVLDQETPVTQAIFNGEDVYQFMPDVLTNVAFLKNYYKPEFRRLQEYMGIFYVPVVDKIDGKATNIKLCLRKDWGDKYDIENAMCIIEGVNSSYFLIHKIYFDQSQRKVKHFMFEVNNPFEIEKIDDSYKITIKIHRRFESTNNLTNSKAQIVVKYRDSVLKQVNSFDIEGSVITHEEFSYFEVICYIRNFRKGEAQIYNMFYKKNVIVSFSITGALEGKSFIENFIFCFDYERTWVIFTGEENNLFESL